MLLLITLVVIVAAAAAGLTYNRRVWRPRQAADRMAPDGMSITEVAVPLGSLSVLLLAFVLVQSFDSWRSAGVAETSEATATLLLFREVDQLRSPAERRDVRREVVCYARSVIGLEWPAMAHTEFSNVPAYWAALVRGRGLRLERSGGAAAATGHDLVVRDSQRAQGRQQRLGEVRPSTPLALYLLMLLSVAATLVVIGVVTARSAGPAVHMTIVVATAGLFAATLLMIYDLDQPYDGTVGRAPTQTRLVLTQMEQQVEGPLPCDAEGRPKRAPGFEPQTTPLL